MKTTLNAIRKHHPCKDGWEKLLKHLGKTSADDEPLSLLTILKSNGLDHALWCFRAVDGFEKEKQLLAITYAREVEHLMPAESKKALDVFERYANGLATQDEFHVAAAAARDAAWSAAWADSARAVVAAAYAAPAAAYSAWAAARDAAPASAYAAADAYAYSADAVYAAWGAAHSTTKAKQENQLRQLLDKTCTQP